MQPIDKVVTVDSNDDLRNTVIKMTEKPQGAALVLNNEKNSYGDYN